MVQGKFIILLKENKSTGSNKLIQNKAICGCIHGPIFRGHREIWQQKCSTEKKFVFRFCPSRRDGITAFRGIYSDLCTKIYRLGTNNKANTLRKLAHAIYRDFLALKIENCQVKSFDIFLIFAQNIDCGYTLEPPRRGGSNEYPQSIFWSKNKKNRYTPAYPSFAI